MKIKSVEAVRLELPQNASPDSGRRGPSWAETAEVANPMSVFPEYKRHRSLWTPKWPEVGVKVTAEDGTWGFGQTSHGRPVAAVIEDHFATHLAGENCLAIERLWDMMFRMSKPYGTQGLTACAISGVDLALWDLAGKLQDKAVYELIGGPTKDKIFCYATGNDVDWYQELGFRAFKLACPFGPADGLDGVTWNEEFVARARETVGDDAEIMLDCYMAFDVEYTVRLAHRLRPYSLRWMEEFLIPEDISGHLAVRKRVDWIALASGEHMTTRFPFQQMIEKRCLDILQPDINWVGGLTECMRICHMALGAGLEVCLHGGGNQPFGQHLSLAMPNVRWIERVVQPSPGVPLDANPGLPGTAIPRDGYLVPSDAPGFGLELKEEWMKPFFS